MNERTLRVEKTLINVYEGKNLHILDLNLPGTISVAHAISLDYLNNLYGWLGNNKFERIFIYHVDGYVSEWLLGKGHKFVSKDDTEIYYPFLEESQKRKNTLLN